MVNDPIADLLTRIRNAQMARHKSVDVPASKMKAAVAKILADHGFVAACEQLPEGPQGTLRITLKYVNGHPAIQEIQRVSRPGIRRYVGSHELPRVKQGLGIGIVSTPKGVMTDEDARRQKVGGEVICTVF